jgi:amino acid transporter
LYNYLGAFCYAEIGTLIPRSGAELTYLKKGILMKEADSRSFE